MPLIKYKCNNITCNNFIRKLFKNNDDIKSILDCGECSIGKLVRDLSGPSSNSIEYVDNGVSPRKVRLMAEIKEKERTKERD